MDNINSKYLTLNFSSHVRPLSTTEMKTTFGGSECYGSSVERLCRFLQKLIYGN